MGILDGDECQAVVSGSGRDVGNYKAAVTGLTNANYVMRQGVTVTQDFTISPLTVEIAWGTT